MRLSQLVAGELDDRGHRREDAVVADLLERVVHCELVRPELLAACQHAPLQFDSLLGLVRVLTKRDGLLLGQFADFTGNLHDWVRLGASRHRQRILLGRRVCL